MSRCAHCLSGLPFDAWWCPSCARRTVYAPKGAGQYRPAELTPTGALRDADPYAAVWAWPLSPPPPAGTPAGQWAPPAQSERTDWPTWSSSGPPAAPPQQLTFGWLDPTRPVPPTPFPIADRFVLDPTWEAAYRRKLAKRRRKRRSLLAALALAIGTQTSIVAYYAASRSSPATPRPVSVQLLSSSTSSNGNMSPIVEVTIGDNPPVPLTLDTGSVGMRVFSRVIDGSPSSGVSRTSRRDAITYADGSDWSGNIATAIVTIGGIKTTTAVPFELVDKVVCEESTPQCPAAGGTASYQYYGSDGILGIGLYGTQPDDPASNPLLGLPGAYGQYWAVQMAQDRGPDTDGHLVLGSPAPSTGTTVIHLESVWTDAGDLAWNDAPRLCWEIASRSYCEPTVFDTGSQLMYIKSKFLFDRHAVSCACFGDKMLASDLPVSVSLSKQDHPFWTFTSGGDPGASEVNVADTGQQIVNSGVQAFFGRDFYYDYTDGTIAIASP